MSAKIMDFQKATAERIYYIFKELGHRRVLLADEVGLGKTFVAKQVIGLVREWHKQEGDDFFKVVYICSNANIADQNIEKLGVNNKMNISESRLSMQHLYITLENKKVIEQQQNGEMPESIIPLTPFTSFRFCNSQGTANERALIFCILRSLNCFKDIEDELSAFLRYEVKYWDVLINNHMARIEQCGDSYLSYMKDKLNIRLSSQLIENIRSSVKNSDNRNRIVIINTLRRVFAEISIDMLDPDLVIMDEFQRFNSLLEQGDDEQSMLTNKFFDHSHSNTKILLLSATPYKLYSTLEELNTEGADEHYRDFMKVIDFLFVTKDSSERFKIIWQHYSAALKRLEVKELPLLIKAKNEAQNALYGVMCRTERFNLGIIDDSQVIDVKVINEDILSYAQCQNMMDRLSRECTNKGLGNLSMEYVKSAPYLLSFMNNYELKKSIVKALQEGTGPQNYRRVIDQYKYDTLLLKKYDINNYKNISPANGKLKYLHDLVFGQRHEKKVSLLLWMPASYPYYQAGGLFESEDARNFSKILLFSSWEMVPRMISVMMSYYAELYTYGKLEKSVNSPKYISTRKKRYGESRLNADGILEYPCCTLAAIYNPAEFYGKKISEIKNVVRKRIDNLLTSNDCTKDLQRSKGQNNAKSILTIMKMLDNEALDENDTISYIPANALDVLTDIAIASPAVCAYRRSNDKEDAQLVGKTFVSLFNKSESAVIIDLIYSKKSDDDYYVSVLDYCVQGNLQAVLDEYRHMLKSDDKLGVSIKEALLDTNSLQIDTDDSIDLEEKRLKMRVHFAIPFIDKTITDKSVARTKNIRRAFNSPFRPFILSTTSIGQEGLDFHWYSRKIVHWNLPSNPVDLEQREGRINRYKCLAIRRNVVNLFKDDVLHTWDELFDMAYCCLKGKHSDIVPFWCLPVSELTEEQRSRLDYIERIVPLYPLSRDRYRYEHLIKILACYRMTMGQPRQEELLSLLNQMDLSEQQLEELTIDLCPYSKELFVNERV